MKVQELKLFMENLQKYSPPENGLGDHLHSITKASVGSIPMLGNAAAELFSALLAPPLEKRRLEWMEKVADGLQRLEQKEQISLEDLKSNTAFTTVLLQASDAAMRSHQEDKTKKLKNAVLNSAVSIKIEDDLQLLFIRFVHDLSISHMLLLKFMRDNGQAIKGIKSYEELYIKFRKLTPDKEVDREEFQLLCSDLNGRILVKISPTVDGFDDVGGAAIVTTGGGDDKPTVRVTNIGRQFLNFVSEPAEIT